MSISGTNNARPIFIAVGFNANDFGHQTIISLVRIYSQLNLFLLHPKKINTKSVIDLIINQ